LGILNTTGTSGGISYTDTFAAGAGSGNYRPLSITYTVNNTGAQTGNTTGIFLNATLTNLNGMTHNLMDLQVGGVSAFRVANVPMGIGIQTSGSWVAYNNSPVQLVGIQGGAFYVLNSTIFFQIDLGNGDTRNVGNLFLGSVAVIPTSRLQVRGNGVNPIARFENNAGTGGFTINSTGTFFASIASVNTGLDFGSSTIGLYTSSAPSSNSSYFPIFGRSSAVTSGTVYGIDLGGLSIGSPGLGFTSAACSANFRPLNLAYTINNSGAQTGTATGIFLRSTETNLNGMLHNFIDLGTIALGSLFSIANNGAIRVATIADSSAPISSLYFSSTANKLVWKDAGGVVNNLY
jgi:hypothetical protein